ncbi:hypothetical protein LINPERHAP1_LOCUS38247 [Linum perenne]
MTTHVFINIIAFIALSALLLHGVLGDLVCEELPVDKCAYSISESGKRCVLENYISRNGMVNYQCKTSEVVVDNMKDMIESEECIKACGVDRNTVGISSDYLLTRKFVSQLCSRPCFQSCPNIVDLYSNLALAEGGWICMVCAAGEFVVGRCSSLKVRVTLVLVRLRDQVLMLSLQSQLVHLCLQQLLLVPLLMHNEGTWNQLG